MSSPRSMSVNLVGTPTEKKSTETKNEEIELKTSNPATSQESPDTIHNNNNNNQNKIVLDDGTESEDNLEVIVNSISQHTAEKTNTAQKMLHMGFRLTQAAAVVTFVNTLVPQAGNPYGTMVAFTAMLATDELLQLGKLYAGTDRSEIAEHLHKVGKGSAARGARNIVLYKLMTGSLAPAMGLTLGMFYRASDEAEPGTAKMPDAFTDMPIVPNVTYGVVGYGGAALLDMARNGLQPIMEMGYKPARSLGFGQQFVGNFIVNGVSIATLEAARYGLVATGNSAIASSPYFPLIIVPVRMALQMWEYLTATPAPLTKLVKPVNETHSLEQSGYATISVADSDEVADGVRAESTAAKALNGEKVVAVGKQILMGTTILVVCASAAYGLKKLHEATSNDYAYDDTDRLMAYGLLMAADDIARTLRIKGGAIKNAFSQCGQTLFNGFRRAANVVADAAMTSNQDSMPPIGNTYLRH